MTPYVLMYIVLALFVYLDGVLTYAAVSHLGARELVLTFLNDHPEAAWIVAVFKNLGVLYLFVKRRKYPWLDYAVAALAIWHVVVVLNGVVQISAALGF